MAKTEWAEMASRGRAERACGMGGDGEPGASGTVRVEWAEMASRGRADWAELGGRLESPKQSTGIGWAGGKAR